MAKKTNQKKVKITRADLVKMANKLKRNRERILKKYKVPNLVLGKVGKPSKYKIVVCKELPPELKTPEVKESMKFVENLKEKIARAEARIAADRLRVEKLRAEKKKKEEEEAAKKNLPNSLWPAIHKSLASISSLCADAKYRPMQNCIAIYENDILVTDGYVAIRRKITDKDKRIAGEFPLSESLKKLISEKPKYPILIPKDIFTKAISNVKKSTLASLETLKVMQDEKGFMLVSNDLEKEIITRVRNIEGDYPREGFLKLIPDDKELPIFETTFDAEFLLKLAKEISHNNKSVTLRFYNKREESTPAPIIVLNPPDKDKSFKDSERIGILMPIKR